MQMGRSRGGNQTISVYLYLAGSIHENGGTHTHGGVSHSHDHGSHDHGHTHEVMDSPGKYIDRDRPVYRTDWNEVQ